MKIKFKNIMKSKYDNVVAHNLKDRSVQQNKLTITESISNENNQLVNVIHWYSSKLGIKPKDLNIRNSRNVFDREINGLWCVPYGINKKLNTMWCQGGYKNYHEKDIGVVISLPKKDLSLYTMGLVYNKPWSINLAASLCKNDDNGLVIKTMENASIIKIFLGQWIDNKLHLDEVKEDFFESNNKSTILLPSLTF